MTRAGALLGRYGLLILLVGSPTFYNSSLLPSTLNAQVVNPCKAVDMLKYEQRVVLYNREGQRRVDPYSLILPKFAGPCFYR